MFTESKRLADISLADIRVVFDRANKLEAEGRDIIHMEIGRPDFDTPAEIKNKAKEALDEGMVHYTSNHGLYELREEFAAKLKRENNIELSPEGIIVTTGAMMALTTAVLGLVDEGEEVLIPSPGYPSFFKQVKLAGATPIDVPLALEDGFSLSREVLADKYSEKTKMLVLNSPNNPTGAVQDKKALQEVAEFAKEKDIYVLADECYEKFVFEGEHISIASLPGMQERTLTVHSTSKSFSMTGWRIGFISALPEIIDSLIKVPQNMILSATAFAQAGSIAAYQKGDSLIEPMIEAFAERRKIVADYLTRMPGVKFAEPGGGFYAFPDISATGLEPMDFCEYLLEEAGVAVVPGDDFGKAGEGCIRIAFTCATERVEEGMERMLKAVKKLN